MEMQEAFEILSDPVTKGVIDESVNTQLKLFGEDLILDLDFDAHWMYNFRTFLLDQCGMF